MACCSVTKSCLILCDPHGLQHSRPPCPSSSLRVCPTSCPLSRWCHPTISSSVVPFSSCPQSFPASGSFPMSQLFASDGRSIGASASPSVLLMNIPLGFPSGLTALISVQFKGLSRVFSRTTIRKHQFFGTLPYLWSNSHFCIWLLERPYLWLYTTLSTKWCLCFLTHCLYVCYNFLSKKQSSLSFMAAVTICTDFRAQEEHCFHLFPFYLPWSGGTGCHDLSFYNIRF